jgi:lytic cellulose monooxygenase (C1-hydroxylating)
MGLMPDEKVKVQDVDFFKVDENSYDPKTRVWGTDQLIKDNSTRTVTIPSDIKPGMYIVRHEIIGLHFAWHENKEKQTSGAQLYPVCFSKWFKK